jgi:hypothetical protein
MTSLFHQLRSKSSWRGGLLATMKAGEKLCNLGGLRHSFDNPVRWPFQNHFQRFFLPNATKSVPGGSVISSYNPIGKRHSCNVVYKNCGHGIGFDESFARRNDPHNSPQFDYYRMLPLGGCMVKYNHRWSLLLCVMRVSFIRWPRILTLNVIEEKLLLLLRSQQPSSQPRGAA